MKQIKLFSALLMCLFALGFASCGDDEDNGGDTNGGNAGGGTTTQFEIDDLYGGWKYESGSECTVYHFASDNGGVIVKNADSENYDRSDIIYKVDDDVTTLTIIAGESSKKEYTIFLLNDEKLVLEDSSEKTYTLKRYKGNIDEEYPVKVAPTHEAVDLGLSVKWATCNVGAESPEEYGDYFAWGETQPKAAYTSDNCKTLEKNIGDIAGNPAYDAATANWGDGWRMPTKTEMQELIDNCTWTWTTKNGVTGYKVKSKKNGNSIFFPSAGEHDCDDGLYDGLDDVGEDGNYWSSTPVENYDPNYKTDSYVLEFRGYSDYDEYIYKLDFDVRCEGHSIRPVKD